VRPWDHRTNPAYFGFGPREYAEFGFSSEFAFGNTAFGLSDIFSETIVIDLDEIYEKTPDRGLRIGSTLGGENHLGVKLPATGLGFGVFTDTSSLTMVTVPREFIRLLTQGNEIDQSYSASTEFVQRSFLETGGYATYEYLGFLFAAKLSSFTPLAYTDTNTEATFKLSTSTGSTTEPSVVQGEVAAGGDIYTSVGDEGTRGFGFNVSLGAIKPDEDGKPLYGGAINSIPVVAARPAYAFDIEQFRYTFEGQDLLGSFDGGDIFDTTESEGDTETVTLDDGDRPRIHMPISLSGFYRFAVPVVDIIPSAEVVFGDYPRLNGHLRVEGNVLPANIFSVGLGYQDFLWQGYLGLRAPFRAVETEFQIQAVGTEIAGIFDGRGLGFSLSMAFGY
jgi:hypothetical protein